MPERSGPDAYAEPSGSVYIEVQISGRWAVSVLTKGWSDDEKRALMAGDAEAREELIAAAVERVLNMPDDTERTGWEISGNVPERSPRQDGCTCPFPDEPGYVKRDCPVHDPDGTYHGPRRKEASHGR